MHLFLRKPVLILVLFSIIFLDQVTKFYFASICNSDAALGILSSNGSLVIVLSSFVVLVCFYYLLTSKSALVSLFLTFVVAGGVSNLLDRLTIGCVRDFIDLRFFPSFNVADAVITMGIAFLMLKLLFTKSENG